MFRWDAGTNHSSSRENGSSVRFSCMLKTFLIVEFHSFQDFTEGFFWWGNFSFDDG